MPGVWTVAQFGATMDFKREFDYVFSNATLHWMKADPPAVCRAVHAALRDGGTFVAEFGGQGNVRAIVEALGVELEARGSSSEQGQPAERGYAPRSAS
mmetsp:Transcript_92632/g.299646  ORF Transcript_92632/g.299646 Transcript_92632/m.299646 type:complete len:98 (-) Transcript_92632:73-366(-)